jgi:hypothetical protein
VVIETVHVVAKAHLDLGFTALAAEVERRYLAEWFPQAIATAGELRERGGAERLVWTTGSWILDRALADADADADADGDASLAGAVDRGDLAWHALPFTTHTELMDAALVRAGMAISHRLDARFDRPTTTAAKLTDVPGHTRGLVPLLVEAGVTFLHVGVNPAWPMPEVPPVFRWRSPDDAEVVVAYQSGGYGGQVVVPGCTDALAFLHAGDNGGPPTADEVVAAHAELADRFPSAEVRGSTLDAFARALANSGAARELPVVTAEIGDPWIFGVASDPQKVSAYGSLLRQAHGRASTAGQLLLVAEHTWGLDQKTHLPDVARWDRAGLAALRSSEAGRRFEASWAEQRAYASTAAPVTGSDVGSFSVQGASPVTLGARRTGLSRVETLRSGTWEVEVDDDGALRHLLHRPTGRVLADAAHPLGLLTYQSFDEADYERFFAQLTPGPHDDGWARLDNTKPGIDAAGAVSGRWWPQCIAIEVSSAIEVVSAGNEGSVGNHIHTDDDVETDSEGPGELLLRLRFDGVVPHALGAPPEAWARWRFGDDIELDLWWPDKPASRLPEALWCSFVPVVAEPERWAFEKLGQAVSPLDVVRHGGRSLHAVGEGGCTYHGPDGRLQLRTHSAPLVAPGAPNLLDADPPLPDLAGGLHVLLHDNCWGTNFPMWNEGPARFRFTLQP